VRFLEGPEMFRSGFTPGCQLKEKVTSAFTKTSEILQVLRRNASSEPQFLVD
jgi:hypothetical protein